MLDFITNDFQSHHEDEALQSALGGANSGVMSGIVAGTKVATIHGWQRVEDIKVGDAVLTFDNGLRPVRAIRRQPLWNGIGKCPGQFRPLHVPAGVLGNREAMIVLPHQGLVVESDAAEAALGDPFAMVRAEELEGVCGIERVSHLASVEVFVIQFDENEIVFTAHGALCVCAAAGDLISQLFETNGGQDYRLLSSDFDAGVIADIRCEIIEAWLDGEDRCEDAEIVYDMPRVA
ncbi:Hint domain-containing protein [Pseudooceanicola sp.]|uniref:Hint domain-containing protein n=1 Tax=Pseudooceanicola sp. TaxID=1914328 RepID=UPI0026253CFF|nr:Hint domain-containing protein [Pseudooceanicola sp.]MDF1854501.1 Hint domain-containing protein [Pseudooceanicola sp.]